MKKTYCRPTTIVVRLQHQGMLMQSIFSIENNAGLDFVGGGNGEALAPEMTGIDIMQPEW